MRWIAVLFLVILIACSNPRDTPLPKDISKMESIKPAIEKLNPEERELVAGYIMRHTVGEAFGGAFGIKANPIPDGMTIGKAIDEQRGIIETQKAEAATEKANQEKAAALRKALSEQMAKVLSVRLADIQLHKASFQNFDVENRINLAIEFENKGSKTITGLKGLAIFKDKFGDTVSELPIKVEQEIPARKNVNIKLSKNYNQFDNVDQKLANLDAASINFSISPEVILFSDGTKFEAPKAKE
jgi:hypothetical protein